MKANPRAFHIQNIQSKMASAVNEVVMQNKDLTHAELQHILLQIALSWNKYAIRDERKES